MPMGTSEACGDIAGMAAILLRTVRNKLPSAGSALRASGSFAHLPVIMPPMHAAGVRTELLLFPAGRVFKHATALSACIVSYSCSFGNRLYTIALAIGLDSIH